MVNNFVIFGIIYFLFALITAALSSDRRIGFITVLGISIIFTPIAGIITIVCTDHIMRQSKYTTQYLCPECETHYNRHHDYCPTCLDKRKQVKLDMIKHLQVV